MVQNKVRLKIEDVATQLLNNDKLTDYLAFYNFLRNNKMSKTPTSKLKTTWSFKYKNELVCYLIASENEWSIRYFTNTELFKRVENSLPDELKELILLNVNTTPCCKNCNGSDNKLILGKIFNNVCIHRLVVLKNPKGETFEYAKNLVLICKKALDDMFATKA